MHLCWIVTKPTLLANLLSWSKWLIIILGKSWNNGLKFLSYGDAALITWYLVSSFVRTSGLFLLFMLCHITKAADEKEAGTGKVTKPSQKNQNITPSTCHPTLNQWLKKCLKIACLNDDLSLMLKDWLKIKF